MRLTIDHLTATRRMLYSKDLESNNMFYFKNISCTLYGGELTMISSENYINKHMLLNVITHSPNPSYLISGNILYNDRKMELHEIDHLIAYIQNVRGRNKCVSVIDTVKYSKYCMRDRSKTSVNTVLQDLRLFDIKNKNLSEIKFVDLQMVYLAKYVITGKKIIVIANLCAYTDNQQEIIQKLSLIKEVAIKYDLIVICSFKTLNHEFFKYVDKFIGISTTGDTFYCTKETINLILLNPNLLTANRTNTPPPLFSEKIPTIECIPRITYYPISLYINILKYLKLIFYHKKFGLLIFYILFLSFGYGSSEPTNIKINREQVLQIFGYEKRKSKDYLRYYQLMNDLQHQMHNFKLGIFQRCNFINFCGFIWVYILSNVYFEDIKDGCINLFTLYTTNFILYSIAVVVPNFTHLFLQMNIQNRVIRNDEVFSLIVSSFCVFIQFSFILATFLVDSTRLISFVLILLNFITINNIKLFFKNNIFPKFNYLSWIMILFPIKHIQRIYQIETNLDILNFLIINTKNKNIGFLVLLDDELVDINMIHDFYAIDYEYNFMYNIIVDKQWSYYMLYMSMGIVIGLTVLILVFRNIISKRRIV